MVGGDVITEAGSLDGAKTLCFVAWGLVHLGLVAYRAIGILRDVSHQMVQ